MVSTSIYKMNPSVPRKRGNEVWEKEHTCMVLEAKRVTTVVSLRWIPPDQGQFL